MPAPPENSNPQMSPAGYKVHQMVPMQPAFPTLSPEGQASPALDPFGQRVVSETASLRTYFLLNLSLLLTPPRPKQQDVSLCYLPTAEALPTLRAPFHTPWPYPGCAAGSQE